MNEGIFYWQGNKLSYICNLNANTAQTANRIVVCLG